MVRTRAALVAVAGVLLASCSAGPRAPSVASPSDAISATGAVTSGQGLPWPAPPERPLPDEVSAGLRAEVDRWIDDRLLPGVTVAVVTPDGTWSGAAGVDGAGTPLRPDSGMALASITKTFTAAEVMLLAERGLVDLDAPASRYVPEPQVANGVTVRQLLAQRALLGQADEAAWDDVDVHLDRHWSPEEAIAPVPTSTSTPGRAFRYDNANYVVLGQVIAKVTGEDVATVIRRDLATPLGLDRLAYQDAERLAAPLARPGAGEDGIRPPDGPYLPMRSVASAFGAAAGMAGDAATVARWGYQLYGGLLLRPSSVEQMTDFGDGDGYGLGTFDYSDTQFGGNSVEAVGHLGVLEGYRTVLAVFPTRRLSIAVLTPSDVESLGYVRRLLRAGGFQPG